MVGVVVQSSTLILKKSGLDVYTCTFYFDLCSMYENIRCRNKLHIFTFSETVYCATHVLCIHTLSWSLFHYKLYGRFVNFHVKKMDKVFFSCIISEPAQVQWFASVYLIIECSSVDVSSLLCCLTSSILVEWSEYQLYYCWNWSARRYKDVVMFSIYWKTWWHSYQHQLYTVYCRWYCQHGCQNLFLGETCPDQQL